MHPLLASPRRLLLYLLAWLPIAALMIFVVGAADAPGWYRSAAMLGPASLVYAFVCLSPWYVCRTRPLGVSQAPGLVLTWAGAAIAGSLVLLGSSRLAALAIEGSDAAVRPHLPFLLGAGALTYLLSGGLHYAALAALASREAERSAVEARALAHQAELQALKAQLNPHFLFNSLNSISALTAADPARAREMCIRLADFFRGSLALGAHDTIPFHQELALARAYLDIERVRFGARLCVAEEIDPACAECAVPALVLQPLVENAVKHGVAGLLEGGTVRIAAHRLGSEIVVTVENAFDPESAPAPASGVGLANVRRRLAARYGAAARADAGPDGSVYRVVLRFPCASPIAASSRL